MAQGTDAGMIVWHSAILLLKQRCTSRLFSPFVVDGMSLPPEVRWRGIWIVRRLNYLNDQAISTVSLPLTTDNRDGCSVLVRRFTNSKGDSGGCGEEIRGGAELSRNGIMEDDEFSGDPDRE